MITAVTVATGQLGQLVVKQLKISFIRLLSLLCVLYFNLMIFPNDLSAQTNTAKSSPIQVTVYNPDDLYKGYLLWHQSDELQEDVENISLLTDENGNVINTWKTNLTSGGAPAYLLENGLLIRTGILNPETFSGGSIASTNTIQIVDTEGNVVWQYNSPDPEKIFFHHDFEPMPNGNILISIYHVLYASEAKNLGWKMGENDRLWVDEIYEIKPDLSNGTTEIVWKWSIADHLIQDKNPDIANYGIISEHPERIDPNFPKSYAPKGEMRQHVNSIDYNADLDQIVLSSLIYNEIWIIDHSTTTSEAASSKGGSSGKGGDLLFRYGNPAAYGLGKPQDQIFSKQHDANWIEPGLPGEGNLIVHNNNTLFGRGQTIVEGRTSQIYELKLPVIPDGTYKHTAGKAFEAEIVWFWENPEYYATFQGGARRLPNGNTLITDTVDRLVLQVNTKGDIVAEYKGSAPVYKAFMYSPDYVKNITN